MAKKKKTLDELLEEAFVPENEVPYRVPENWVWTNLGTLISVSSGKGLPKSKMNPEGSIPVYGGNGITGFHDMYNIEEEKVIIGRVGANCGNVHITNKKAWVTDNAFIVSYTDEKLNKMYLYRLLDKINLGQYSKSSAQPVISGQKIYPVSVPFPPLSEQNRIVQKIEFLFSKLDKSKELIEEARDGFENRKSAILAKAFRGELTKKWREENTDVESVEELLNKIEEERIELIKNKIIKKEKIVSCTKENEQYEIPSKWRWVTLSKICNKITDGAHNTPKKLDEGYAYITAQHIKPNYIDFDNCYYMSEQDHKELYNKCYPEKGDILIVNIGAGSGACAIVNVEFEFSFKNIAILKRNPNVNEKFVYYHQLYDRKRILSEISKGGAQPFLSLKKIKELTIPLPPIEEQNQIVKILDKLLEEESKIKELTQLKEQIELIKKSILAKAFRGELGTNDPSEESALELLKDILKEKL